MAFPGSGVAHPTSYIVACVKRPPCCPPARPSAQATRTVAAKSKRPTLCGITEAGGVQAPTSPCSTPDTARYSPRPLSSWRLLWGIPGAPYGGRADPPSPPLGRVVFMLFVLFFCHVRLGCSHGPLSVRESTSNGGHPQGETLGSRCCCRGSAPQHWESGQADGEADICIFPPSLSLDFVTYIVLSPILSVRATRRDGHASRPPRLPANQPISPPPQFLSSPLPPLPLASPCPSAVYRADESAFGRPVEVFVRHLGTLILDLRRAQMSL